MDTVELPPCSEIEVLARIPAIQVLQESLERPPPVAVARALIEPTDTTVPVRLLNTKASPVTVYEGSTLATLEEVDADSVGPPRP